MKILNGNTLYEFTVAQTTAETSDDLFHVEFRYRKLRSPSQIELEENRAIQCDRAETQSFITNLLIERSVPEQTRGDMETHFTFYIDRVAAMARRRGRRSAAILVSLDAKEVSPEIAAAIVRRRERGSRRVVETAVAEVVAVEVPAKKAVVERLERERVVVVEEERECAICLEKFGEEGKGIELPCLHVYHKECIIQWLGRNHVCPFCRFKLID